MDNIKFSKGGIMNQIDKIQDKIKGEIETAKKSLDDCIKEMHPIGADWKYYNGKVKSLQDIQQWIQNNIEEG